MRKIISNLLITIFLVIIFNSHANAFSFAPYKIVESPKGVYVVEVNTAKKKYKLQPVVVTALESNADVYNRLHPKFIVNAGFFDPKNQQTVSYVYKNGHIVLDPKNNENLMNNNALEPYMNKILNRSEFRILKNNKGKYIYDIATHNDKIPQGLTLVHSIQAGPLLVPNLRLTEEFFVLERDGLIISESASCLHKYARTAIGIKNNKVYIFIITGQSAMTLAEVAEIAKAWGMEKAMAFDGGGSTSFDSKELHIISEEAGQGRKLKSFLMLK